MIYNKYLDSGIGDKVSIILNSLKKGFSLKNILFVILSIVLVGQTFMGDFTPFSFVLLGVASVFNVPLLLVLLSSVVGFLISSITTIALIKLLAFFVVFTLITALINIEGVSRRYSVFIKLMVSTVVIELVFGFIQSSLFTGLFPLCASILIVALLYFIFVSGIYVLVNTSKSYVFSKEESVAMITVVALALTIFKDVNLLGFSIFNVLILVITLIYGWRNGAVSGGAAGLIVGLFLTGITNISMTYVVLVAFSGLIAGLLGKVGKVAVVIGFVLGFIYISYYANGLSELTIRGSELLIASLSLLFIPKKLELQLDKFFNKNNTLPRPYENMLDTASSVKSRIGAVSEVFDSLADISIENTPENAKETREVIKKYIIDFVDNTCIDCKNRKDCSDDEKLDITVDIIATKLENGEVLDKTELPTNCNFSDNVILNLQEVYSSMKLMRLLKQKEKENSVKISNQYKEVSKILSNVAKNIKNVPQVVDKSHEKLRNEFKFYGFIVYEDDYIKEDQNIEYTFVTDILNDIDKQKKEIISIASDILEQNMTIKLILNSSKKEKSRIKLVSTPAYEIQTAIIGEIKTNETVSGDSYLSMDLEDMKHMSVISDGAGSGINASKSSTAVINMLEKLLSGGFEEDKAIEIINSVVKLKANDTSFSTLDVAIINQKTAEAQFIKLGSAPTYIIEDSKVITINNTNIPVGLVKDTDYLPICKKLSNGSFVIQISDGVVQDNTDINNNYFTEYLKTIDTSKTQKMIADELHKLVLKENKNILKDDVTILVTKIKKSENK